MQLFKIIDTMETHNSNFPKNQTTQSQIESREVVQGFTKLITIFNYANWVDIQLVVAFYLESVMFF